MSDGLDHTDFFGWEMHELGNDVQIKGVAIGDERKSVILLLPNEVLGTFTIEKPTAEKLQDWLKATDDPKFLEIDGTGVIKAIHRKMTRHVDQELMWETYRRDDYTCQYCGAKDRAMTYDHWIPQTVGGVTTLENGVTACRPCNKKKGHMAPETWVKYMQEKGYRGNKAIA